jgi:2-oxoglutarate ferredoxin oxidoreductase subunit delta
MKQVEEAAEATAPEAAEDTPAARKKGPRGRVQVFDNWCKGCGICIAFCPQQVFETGKEGRPLVARPKDCTACRRCEIHCPDLAIVVTRMDEEAGR